MLDKLLLRRLPELVSNHMSDQSLRSVPSRAGNYVDYRRAFLAGVHKLLRLAYSMLTPSDYVGAEEEDITGEMRKHMRYLTEDAPTEPWMNFYSVHNEDPVDDVLDPETKKKRKGKKRPRLDIRFVWKQRIPNTSFCVEAKRLYRRDSPSKYVGDDGLGAFLSGYYAKGSDASGMLGYVQAESLNHWLPRLTVKIGRAGGGGAKSRLQPLVKQMFEGGPNEVYVSRHSRKGDCAIEVFHTFLAFNDP